MTSLTQKLLNGLTCHFEHHAPQAAETDEAETESVTGSYWQRHLQKFDLNVSCGLSPVYSVQFEYRTWKI